MILLVYFSLIFSSLFFFQSCSDSVNNSNLQGGISSIKEKDSEEFIMQQVIKTIPDYPGKEGEKTLLGIDSDEDGVRDDVELKLIVHYDSNIESLKKAFLISKNIGKMSDEDWKKYKIYIDSISFEKDLISIIRDVEALHLNTQERLTSYRLFFSK